MLGTYWHKKTRDGHIHNAQAHSKGQGIFNLTCICVASWAAEPASLAADEDQQLSGLFGPGDLIDTMSLTSNTGHSPRDATAHSTSHMSVGYTQVLEGGHHPAWGESIHPASLTALIWRAIRQRC